MLLISVVILAVSACLTSAHSNWGYTGATGPRKWGTLYSHCSGDQQSPININTRTTTFNSHLGDFYVGFTPSKSNSRFRIQNNGHTVGENVGDAKFYIKNGGLSNIYSTQQIHFHWGSRNNQGSEHTVNGKSSPLEMHIVSYNSGRYSNIARAAVQKDGLAVLGILFQLSENDNPALESILGAIKQVQDPHWNDEVKIPAQSIRALLPAHTEKYYRYRGSLTTPPCYESVIWTVFKKKQTISPRQLQVFRSVLQDNGGSLVNNYRPVQQLNSRTVYRSFWEDDDDDDDDDDW